MINLLGDEVENLKFLIFIKIKNSYLWKKRSKNGRKMGHITYPI